MGELSFTTECDRDVQAELCEQPSPLELSDTSICSWLSPHPPSQQGQSKQQPDILFLPPQMPRQQGNAVSGSTEAPIKPHRNQPRAQKKPRNVLGPQPGAVPTV